MFLWARPIHERMKWRHISDEGDYINNLIKSLFDFFAYFDKREPDFSNLGGISLMPKIPVKNPADGSRESNI